MIKVSGYCRVSTDKEDQANSFAAQQRYFRDYIRNHPDWQLYEIYADEGITGTSTKKRIQFNRMIQDAYRGKFTLIITKEVSRFSRNILDTITYTRELKALGVGVIFMSDGFCSLDPDAELRLSIMGSIAQEESRKTSSRVKWGQKRQMERGVVFGHSLLGYDVCNGKLTISPEDAEIVRQIFYKYGIEKKSTTVIAGELREAGYRTHTGNPFWSVSHLMKILKNEKYVGDLVQKKTITPDYLSHAKKYNHGEEAPVIISNHHEPIVSRELWNQVQEEIVRRRRNDAAAHGHSCRYIFSGKIQCAECGAAFVSRVKSGKDGTSYRRWSCATAAREGRKKTDPHGNMLGCDVGKLLRDDLATKVLTTVIGSLPLDFGEIIQNVAKLAENAVLNSETQPGNADILNRRIKHTEEKKCRMIDAFLAGILSGEELSRMKSRYDDELDTLKLRLNQTRKAAQIDPKELRSKIYTCTEAIITCKTISEPYLKMLLGSMIVHQDGKVDVTLEQLSMQWTFQLIKIK